MEFDNLELFEAAHKPNNPLGDIDNNRHNNPDPRSSHRSGKLGYIALLLRVGRPFGVDEIALLRVVAVEIGLLANDALHAVYDEEHVEDKSGTLMHVPEDVEKRSSHVLDRCSGDQAERNAHENASDAGD